MVSGIVKHYAAVDGPIDILGQWTCQACGLERVRRAKTRCFRCGCPKGHMPPQPDPFVAGPLGGLPQRTALTNPTYRPQRQNSKPVPPIGTTHNFPPLNQPLPVGLVDAAASGSVPAFPAGSLDWLVATDHEPRGLPEIQVLL